MKVSWASSSGAVLGSEVIGPVTAKQRKDVTGLLRRSGRGTVPEGAVEAVVTIVCTRVDGAYDDGYADDVALTIVAASR